jgi:hypothetical protein
MITIGSITNLEKNNTLDEQLWQDSDYELIIKFTLVKKIIDLYFCNTYYFNCIKPSNIS